MDPTQVLSVAVGRCAMRWSTYLILVGLVCGGVTAHARETPGVPDIGRSMVACPGQWPCLHRAALAEALRPFGVSAMPQLRHHLGQGAMGSADVLITTAVLGRFAEREGGYQWVGLAGPQRQPVLATREEAHANTLDDLVGATIALPPEDDLGHQLALSELERGALRPHVNVSIHAADSEENALLAVISGAIPAAIVDLATWQRYRPFGWSLLRTRPLGQGMPALAVVAHPRMDRERIATLREALVACNCGVAHPGADAGAIRPVSPGDDELQLLDRALAAYDRRTRRPATPPLAWQRLDRREDLSATSRLPPAR